MVKKSKRQGSSLFKSRNRTNLNRIRKRKKQQEDLKEQREREHEEELDRIAQKSNKHLISVLEHKDEVETFIDDLKLQSLFSRKGKLTLVDKDYSYYSESSLIDKKQRFSLSSDYELAIPKRPKWNRKMTKKEYIKLENDVFFQWRKKIAKIEEMYYVTPFEKNVNYWRHLWRVVENCDVLFQIVDARNPLLFRSKKLEKYVKEINEKKLVYLILNKSDLLTVKQRKYWINYFDKKGINYIFFSAKDEEEKLKNVVVNKYKKQEIQDDFDSIKVKTELGKPREKYDLLTRRELIAFFKSFHRTLRKKKMNIGMIGYPNVGKSSVINVISGMKRVSVAPTPGKTKYVQTIPIGRYILLHDSPGLVFPSVTATKEDMLCNGILPIDKLSGQFVPSVALICRRIPRDVLEMTYGIKIASKNTFCNVNQFLDAYCKGRGLMTKLNINVPVASRQILKDYVNGKLLFCHPPPYNDYEEQGEEEMLIESEDLYDDEEEGEDEYDEEEEGEEEEEEEKGEINEEIVIPEKTEEKKTQDQEMDAEERELESLMTSGKQEDVKETESYLVMLDNDRDKVRNDEPSQIENNDIDLEIERYLRFNQKNVQISKLLDRFVMKTQGKRVTNKQKRNRNIDSEKEFIVVDEEAGIKISKGNLKRRQKNQEFKEIKEKMKKYSKQELRQLKRTNRALYNSLFKRK